MPRLILAGIAAAMTALLLTTPLQAQSSTVSNNPAEQQQEIDELEKKSQESYEAEKWVAYYVANQKMSKLRPYEPEYLINIVKACAQLGRKSTAYHYMLLLQQQGFSYDFSSMDDTVNIRDTEAYGYINNLLIQAATSAGEGSVEFKLLGNAADYQAIAWDSSRDSFLVGTQSEGSLIKVSSDGDTDVLLKADDENGLWSIAGLAIDVDRNRLWISSSATPGFSGYTAEDKNRGALFELDLKTLEFLGRYYLPADALSHELGNLALTDSGDVYVMDRATPIIYRKTSNGESLEAFFASPELFSLRDIAVTSDNSRLFVADAYKGILAIDPAAQKAALVSGPETMNLSGIRGMEYDAGRLLLIQGGFTPQRVVRLELEGDGVNIKAVVPMETSLAEFDHPAIGTVKGDSLYYIANSGAAEASGIVMKTLLDASVEAKAPTAEDMHKAMKQEMQSNQQ